MNKILLILLFVPFLGLGQILNLFGDDINDSKKEYILEIFATTLYSEFTLDNSTASDKYNNKKIKIIGIIENNIKKGKGGKWYITLKVNERFGFVMCHFHNDFNKDKFSEYSANDEVVLIGICDSYKSMVKVRDCKLF